MKYCKNCSAILDDDAVFCTECGESLADDDFSSALSSESSSDSQGYEGSIPGYTNEPDEGGYAKETDEGSYSNETDSNSFSNNYSNQSNYGKAYSAPKGSNPGTPWLIAAIVSIFCCGGFFAIPGLVFAIMATTSYNEGNVAEAASRANKAKWLTIGAIVLGIIASIAFAVLYYDTM